MNNIKGAGISSHVTGKPLGLFAEILYSSYFQERHKEWAAKIPDYADKYGFTHINIHGAPLLPFLALKSFPEVTCELSGDRITEINYFRSILKNYKNRGLRVTLGSGGVRIPESFFEKYPEAQDIHSGLLVGLIEDMANEYFETIPEADEYEIYFWEAMLVGDGHCVCPEMFYGGKEKMERFLSYPYYAPEDFIADIISAYGRGAQKAGKRFSLLTFSHYKWQEDVLIKAISRVDPSLPIVLDHKCQPGDWTPQRLTNNVLEAFPAREAAMLFDGAGEYWGQCRVPYCYPDEIAYRLRHALEVNPSICEVGMRVMWQFDSVFGNYNEINFYALSELAKDPYRDIGDIFQEWSLARFGEGADTARRALERTNEIGNRIFYIDGAWIFNHSVLSGLPYLESHFVTFGKAMIEWNRHDFNMKGRLREALSRPSSNTLRRVLFDRSEAIRLAMLSLDEVVAGKNLFPNDEYMKLTYQLKLLVDISRMAFMQMELFMRYWIIKVNPEAEPFDNAELFDKTKNQMHALTAEYEENYADEPLINPSLMKSFLAEIETAFKNAYL